MAPIKANTIPKSSTIRAMVKLNRTNRVYIVHNTESHEESI